MKEPAAATLKPCVPTALTRIKFDLHCFGVVIQRFLQKGKGQPALQAVAIWKATTLACASVGVEVHTCDNF